MWQRISISGILEDKWFKKGYKPPAFEKFEGNLDDINAAFAESDVSWKEISYIQIVPNDSHMQLYRHNELKHTHVCVCQDNHVKEKKDEQPAAMNAFELIALSKGLNLENLFDIEKVTLSSSKT